MTNDVMDQWEQMEEKAGEGRVTTAELDALARAYKEAWDKHAAHDKETGRLYREAEDVEAKLIMAMETAGKNKYNVEGIGTFSFTNRLAVPTPKSPEEKQQFARYLEQEGGKPLFWSTFSVNSQTLQSFVKNAVAEHEKKCEGMETPEPFHIPGLQAPTAMKSLRLTKERNKE